MKLVLNNLNVYQDGAFTRGSAFINDDGVLNVSTVFPSSPSSVSQLNNCFLFPGFVDVHVHLREPGFSYKETIRTGSLAAAHGGFTSICSMPNLNPVPDCIEHLDVQSDIIRSSAAVNVYPYGSITIGEKGLELSDMDNLAEKVIAFSDDGKGIQNEELMFAAMKKAKSLGKIIASHCEDEGLLQGGYIHDGGYAKLHCHRGICSESEWRPLQRDLRLAEQTGCAYHVCHVSCKESVALIRKAKKKGVDVSCETAPHYLLLNDNMLQDDGKFKMNPPIRSEEDRQALIEGIKDGTIDMIATDHAPHSAIEKSGGLVHSLNGIVGLETAFPVLYTGLVRTGIITLAKLIELMSTNPSNRFGIGTPQQNGHMATFTIFDLHDKYQIDPNDFLSMGRSTPFEGMNVFGRCLLTMCNGKIVWKDSILEEY